MPFAPGHRARASQEQKGPFNPLLEGSPVHSHLPGDWVSSCLTEQSPQQLQSSQSGEAAPGFHRTLGGP